MGYLRDPGNPNARVESALREEEESFAIYIPIRIRMAFIICGGICAAGAPLACPGIVWPGMAKRCIAFIGIAGIAVLCGPCITGRCITGTAPLAGCGCTCCITGGLAAMGVPRARCAKMFCGIM